MNREELTFLLSEIAEADLAEGSDMHDHPCHIAIRALDKCFEDIEYLQQIANKTVHGKSKRAQFLLKLNYNPSW